MKTKWTALPVFAILLLGCVRENEINTTYIEGEFSLYASYGEEETRTIQFSSGCIYWNYGEYINVFYGNKGGKFKSTNASPATSTRFTGSLGSFTLDGVTEFVAAYPYSDQNTWTNNTLHLRLPSEQTGKEGSFADNLFISVAKSRNYSLHFYNVCGGVKFTVIRDDIKKVVFRGNDSEFLAGRVTVEFTDDGTPRVCDIENGETSVTLVAPDGGTLMPGSSYFIVLLPQSLTKGYTMEFYADDLVETFSSDSPVTVRRSVWGTLNILSDDYTVPETVDLGLPSGIRWATFNLGATKPEGQGYAYAWGETEPKVSYSYENYKWCEGTQRSLTKYNSKLTEGVVDYLHFLEFDDDPARTHLGEGWRLPTRDEWQEVLDNCTVKPRRLNGISCLQITGPNGNFIYLPQYEYWSSTLNDNNYLSSALTSSASPYLRLSSDGRASGHYVRPVYGDVANHVEGVTLDHVSLDRSPGGMREVKATVFPEDATNKNVFWSSSAPSVATVSPGGLITCIAPGSAIITATTSDGRKTAACRVGVDPSFPRVDTPLVVDLGLSVYWATFNVGATKPEESGDYFAWGDVEPYYEYGYANEIIRKWKPGKEAGYSWESYKWCMGSSFDLIKYCDNSEYGYNGFTDDKVTLDPEDDVAQVYLGGGWRMPTREEQQELFENCTFEWTDLNGKPGVRCTGRNGNSIFLPAPCVYPGDGSSIGYYLSSSLMPLEPGYYYTKPNNASAFFVHQRMLSISSFTRSYTGSIRPVYMGPVTAVEEVHLDQSAIELQVGRTFILAATVLPEEAADKSVVWTSSDESVAIVTPDGHVAGMGVGSAVITVTTNNGRKSASCRVTVKELTYDIPEAVDMGLSVKWASFNLGASIQEEYGDYFTWGDTETHYKCLDPLMWKAGMEAGYTWQTYKWSRDAYNTQIKYCTKADFGYNGFTDGKTVLDPEDDAAHDKLGGSWRMPTENEWNELLKNTNATWTTVNGVPGRLLTSKKNGNTLFLPASGTAFNDGISDVASFGTYWSSSLDAGFPRLAQLLGFGAGSIYMQSGERFFGLSVRPVCDE